GLRNVGGWNGLVAKLSTVAVSKGLPATTLSHTWRFMGSPSQNPIGVEWFGLVMGLGFVLSFGYWCTDFLVVQRAMAAKSMLAARRTPLIAALPKMIFPFLVILPGMIALGVGASATKTSTVNSGGTGQHAIMARASVSQDGTAQMAASAPVSQGIIPQKKDQSGNPEVDSRGRPVLDYDLATPMMLVHYFPAGMLGLGLTALLASFMSGMAGNTTAFNTVWTYDLYQGYINKGASDDHLLWMGRFATVFGIALSIGAAYVAASFNNIMDLLQLVFAFVNAPLFATFALGMFWRRTTGHGAFTGLVSGTLAAAIHHGLTLPAGAAVGVKGGFLANMAGISIDHIHRYPSELGQTFWTAIFAWSTCFAVTIIISVLTKPRAAGELKGLVYSLTEKPQESHLEWYKRPWALGVLVLALTVALNFVFF
ncbi:MAG: sodium:solute symporter family transporter, partial [Blastocatellia bacterium]